MKQTRNMLMTVFVGALALAALIVTVFETGALEQGTAVGNSQVEFVITVVMELLTLGQIWFALRLFKIRQIRQDLVSRKEFALRKWGVLRLELLDIPLVANVLFYELFMKPTFGYLAIIVLICQPFVYPSLARCEAEVSAENKEAHEEDNNRHSQL